MKYPGTDPTNLLHRALMAPAALEKLPSRVVLLLLAGLAAGVGGAWLSTPHAVTAAAGWLAVVLLDWLLLAGLPRTRRSFGPVRPPLLALAVVRAGMAALISLTGGAWLMLGCMAAVTLLAWYATWVEPFDIRVTHKETALRDWPAGAPPLRLLHLTDLHLERRGLREERLGQLIDALAPDLICFTGDFLSLSYNDDPQAIADARAVVGRWRAPLGVYAVTGSPLVDLPEAASAILDGLPHLRWLQDQAAVLSIDGRPLTLVGMTCTHNPAVDAKKLAAVLADAQPESPIILLYHTADLAPAAAELERGPDLQLSGHTHGGQIRLPLIGALVTSSLYRKRFEMGEYHLPRDGREPMTLYVSRGIGMEGGAAPRARLLCRPEVVLWTLTGAPTGEGSGA